MADPEREREAVKAAIKNIAERIQDEKKYLTDLDSAIGDADHGANMSRGFKRVVEEIEDMDDASPADLVKKTGTALISEVGGAAGPLYGGSLMKASTTLSDGLTEEATVEFAEMYLESVKDRGGANVGQKTMVDALTPAVHTYKKSIEQDDLNPLEALVKAENACKRGVDFTLPIKAEKGRASFLDWRSVGHQDPGSTSTWMMIQELVETAKEETDYEIDVEANAKAPSTPDDVKDNHES